MFIQGEKIRLRPVTVEDLKIVMEWENDPEFWNITEHDGPLSVGTIMNFIRNSDSLEEDQQLRLIIEDEEGNRIGALDLFEADLVHRSCGIGILIAKAIDRRKGFAQDALSSLIRYQQQQRQIIHFRCLIHVDNEPSLLLFQKNGFEKKGSKYFKGKKAVQFTLDI